MKNILKLLMVLSVVFGSVSCGGSADEGPQVSEKIVAEWHLVSMSGVSTVPQVYVNFAQDMSFELYQKVGDGVHRSITGRYSVNAEKKTISGMYEDNYPWKYDYKFEIKDNTLVLSAVSDTYSVVYTREAIPAEVRQMSLPLVKSVSAQLPRCL